MRRAWLIALCTAALGFGGAPSALAAPGGMLLSFTPQPPLNGPCGLAVAASGNLFVSDYYNRAIDEFSGTILKKRPLVVQGPVNPHTGPLDDPCGLAFDNAGSLYVNNYHRNVVRFPTPLSLGSGMVIDSGDPNDIYANPTGVAVAKATNRVYVDDRTYVSAYDSSGAPLLAGSDPLRIGVGTLQEGFGIAISGYPATAGRIYVPDAATDTVKVYDPAVSTTTPVQSISGPPGTGFGSLRDSAVAVDNSTGEVYVVDTLGTQFTELPQATVYAFGPGGSFEGNLSGTVNAAPTGLAVDNTGSSTQGQVFVTSGITENASISVFGPATASPTAAPPVASDPPNGAAGPQAPSGGSALASAAEWEDGPPVVHAPDPPATDSSIAQEENLRVTVGGKLRPQRLPRNGTAPISVSVGGQISTTDESLPPLLRELRIELNRHGKIDSVGLPACPYGRIQPGSSSHALGACHSSLVGKGSFSADITLAGQEPYPTEGKLLVFNGVRKGKPVLYGHIYSARPFATSFVIVFELEKLAHGTYGTSLIAPLPEAMKAWGRLTGLQMTLSRHYTYKGEPHSYITSGCPAPKGFGKAVFPLARASFAFADGKKLGSVLNGSCRVGK